ncbi:MAG: 1,4-dihydroxy-2-naphthoate octaprenyltransferase [Bdellovibrionales bacterium RBG_16_40_8]|nr:MAG: 1,4-dihydroxy-2-naphthoate octaprenyltransferase [Bdellovibrionales bacterium RBG_16_40_8]
MKTWFIAARPKTLTAAIMPVVAATVLVSFNGFSVIWWVSGLCLFSALCIQIATNFINDAIDFAKGADNDERIGPKRVTQTGLISKKKIMVGAGVFLIMAFFSGVLLVSHGGWPIVLIGVLSLFLAYSYTGGPWPLAYLGLGDLFVILFFGIISVGGVYYLQTGTYDMSAMVLGTQIGFLSAVLIAINNLRDINQDRKARKKTLAVRFGINFVRIEIAALILLTFILQFFWYKNTKNWLTLLPLLLLPLAASVVRQIVINEPSPLYNQALEKSVLLHSGFGLIFSLGLYLI